MVIHILHKYIKLILKILLIIFVQNTIGNIQSVNVEININQF